MNQTASNLIVESTSTRAKQLTKKSNKESNITIQLRNIHENQIMKEPRISVERAETLS